MFESITTFTLANFGLIMLVLALILGAMQWATQQRLPSPEIFYRWVALLPVGLTSIYGFIMHAFFPDYTAGVIGWANSPFQFEVAIANLSIGVIALISNRANYDFRLATVIACTCWFWGDACGHIYQMVAHHNFAPGNAGSWFYLDIIIPIILIACITKLKPRYMNY